MEPKKTGKRIVSKGEYVGRLSKKTGLSSVGLLLLFFLLISFFILVVVIPREGGNAQAESRHLPLTAIFVTGMLFFSLQAYEQSKRPSR